MLAVDALGVKIGSRWVVDQVNLVISPGEIVGVVGANGAGKSSLARAVAGYLRPATGTISIRKSAGTLSLDRKRPSERCRLGIVMVSADRPVFPGLTVRENLAIVDASIGSGPQPLPLNETTIVGPGIHLRPAQAAESLSGGEQRLLALTRAERLIGAVKARGMTSSGFLILDEPSRGLSPRSVDGLAARLSHLASMGVGILLLEQDPPFPTRVASRVHRMELGHIGVAEHPSRGGS